MAIVQYSSENNATCRKRLQEQCKLVLEENELLMEQLDVQHRKRDEQHKVHVQQGRQFATVLENCFFLILCCTCFIITEAGYQAI